MDTYYDWREDELNLAQQELAISKGYRETGVCKTKTPYIEALLWSNLVIDFSGDIWGDNANFLGKDRFLVGLIKDKVAQNLNRKIVMLAGSPGPFTDERTKEMAADVYKHFDLVTNREPISIKLLKENGFDVSNTQSLACPAFLFEPATGGEVDRILLQEGLSGPNKTKPIVGFIVCGWNFEVGPFDKWPRDDSDYIKFAEAIEFISESLDARVCLLSHSNGFDIPPAPFKLKHGRDYPIIKQLEMVLENRGIAKNVFSLNGIYDAWKTKAIISTFDMMVSGRVHAAVAGLSQCVPTVIIDYGHEPKAHKLRGFAHVAGAQDYVADPASCDQLIQKIEKCWNDRMAYASQLKTHIPTVKKLAKMNFELLKQVV